jgi:RHS repeat-associated protein
MPALARHHVTHSFTRAANDDCIKGGPCTRTKYAYDANGNATSRQGSSITWSSYNYPTTVNAGSGSTAETVSFAYGPSRQRWQQTYTGDSTTETTDYIGKKMERVITGSGTTDRYYISGGTGVAAVYAVTSAGVKTFSYVLADHQASVADITNSSGTSVVNESFTPFGQRRNPTTWSGAASNSDLTTAAGITRQAYTFQTQLGLWMGMNHMNGRLEDAVTGRMLSADPTVPDASGAQSYNRYTYVNNNPVSLGDPTGFSPESRVVCTGITLCPNFSANNLASIIGVNESRGLADSINSGNEGGFGGGGTEFDDTDETIDNGLDPLGWGAQLNNFLASINPVSSSGSGPNGQNAVTGGSTLGDTLRSTIPLIGGLLGAAGDVLSGIGNMAAAALTFGGSGTFMTGLEEFGGGIASGVQIGMTDLAAAYIGAVAYGFNNAVNLIDVATAGGSGIYHSSFGTAALGLVNTLVIPDYGDFGGPLWGIQQGRGADQALNSVDLNSYNHDNTYGTPGSNASAMWVEAGWSPTPNGQVAPGPAGIAYVLLGTIPFLIGNAATGH